MGIKQSFSKLLEENKRVHASVPADGDFDFKYVMQDTGNYYFGAKYSYAELLTEEKTPFKFRALVEHYLMKDTDPETTLESQLYYLDMDSFSAKTLLQIKAKVKVLVLEEKRKLFGGTDVRYTEKVLSLSELADINLAKKKASGMVIRELIISKLALMSFSI